NLHGYEMNLLAERAQFRSRFGKYVRSLPEPRISDPDWFQWEKSSDQSQSRECQTQVFPESERTAPMPVCLRDSRRRPTDLFGAHTFAEFPTAQVHVAQVRIGSPTAPRTRQADASQPDADSSPGRRSCRR